MDQQEPLSAALRRVAIELERRQPPLAVWTAVQAAHAQTHRPPRRAWAAWSGAAACAAVLLGSALLMLLPPAEAPAAAASGFVPVVSPERWSSAEGAPAWLVSAELPRERLAALGLPFDPGRAGETVRAELLLHPSGEVLAVRFLQ